MRRKNKLYSLSVLRTVSQGNESSESRSAGPPSGARNFRIRCSVCRGYSSLLISHLPHVHAPMSAFLTALLKLSTLITVFSSIIILHLFRLLCWNVSERFCLFGPPMHPQHRERRLAWSLTALLLLKGFA